MDTPATFATEEQLLGRIATDQTGTVTLANGLVVHVRGLTRREVTKAQEFEDVEAQDRLVVSMALIEPKLTPVKVARWFDTAPAGDTVKVLDKVQELSALKEGARKSDLPDVRE